MADSYRRTYKKKSLNEAYRRYVRGEGSLPQLAKVAKVSPRTMNRYSARDGWVEEREEWKRREAEAASKLAALAATTPEVSADGGEVAPDELITDSTDAKTAMLTVLRRQQKFWTRLELRMIECFDRFEADAHKRGGLKVGQLVAIASLAERVSTGVRKAFGIPDVSRIEWEDKTPAAQKFAERIRERREARLAGKTIDMPAQGGEEAVN